MKFQSEKKELWRYASKNLTSPVRGTNRQQPPPHRYLHQRLPQSRDCVMMQSPQPSPLLEYSDDYGENSTSSATAIDISHHKNISTPPPPYSSVPELDCFSKTAISNYCLTFRQHQTYPTDGETETSVTATESDTDYSRRQAHGRYGCNYANTGGVLNEDDYEKFNEGNISSSYQLSVETLKKTRRITPQQQTSSSAQIVVPTITTTTSSTPSFAATAAKILRNCCGGTFGSSNSVMASPSNMNADKRATNTNTCRKFIYDSSRSAVDHLDKNSNNYLPEQYFNTLMKQLKASQISSLLKAVKSRHDQGISIMLATSTTSSTSSQTCCVANYQTNCIIIRRAEIFDEEPYVIACRLFFWQDLKNASQLKRLPMCPNERDPVYVCCNPLHWCRILETGVSFQNGINSTSFGSTDPDNIWQKSSDQQVRLTESLTTDGEGRGCALNWCEVAYWEMAQRVGERFPADTPTINIFVDKPCAITGDHADGSMCLRELIEKRKTPSPDDVQYTRQKIGLGVTLSQESDGVWLYNRSTVPIFVFSPTLIESWYRVCRIEPGDCLRAFDKCRALTLVHPRQFPGMQTGPVDKFSMRISFGKGWGCSYKRPDITLCPCWLEVLFKTQR